MPNSSAKVKLMPVEYPADFPRILIPAITLFVIGGISIATFLFIELLAWGSPTNPPLWPAPVVGVIIGFFATRRICHRYPCGHEVREHRPAPEHEPWAEDKVRVLDRVEDLLNNPNWGIGQRRVRASKAANLLRKHRPERPQDLRAYFVERERWCLTLAGQCGEADRPKW